jgi:hypothetical protein
MNIKEVNGLSGHAKTNKRPLRTLRKIKEDVFKSNILSVGQVREKFNGANHFIS